MGESDARLLNELHNAMREVYKILPKCSWAVWDPDYPEVIHLKDCFYRAKDALLISDDLEKILRSLLERGYFAITHYDDECENFARYCDENLETDPHHGNYYFQPDPTIRRCGEQIVINHYNPVHIGSKYNRPHVAGYVLTKPAAASS